MPKRKDWLIIAIALLLALVLFILTRSGSKLGSGNGTGLGKSVLIEVTLTPQGTSGISVTPEPSADAQDIAAYLVITVGDEKSQPIPLVKETEYIVRQENGMENVIHVTKDSIYMESATCENQNCIKQGRVDLQNMETRVLGNMIICLPNRVVLELLLPEEVGADTL